MADLFPFQNCCRHRRRRCSLLRSVGRSVVVRGNCESHLVRRQRGTRNQFHDVLAHVHARNDTNNRSRVPQAYVLCARLRCGAMRAPEQCAFFFYVSVLYCWRVLRRKITRSGQTHVMHDYYWWNARVPGLPRLSGFSGVSKPI